mgnify:FL=1
MDELAKIFEDDFLGNPIEAYCWFFGLVLFAVIFQRYLSKLLSNFIFIILQRFSKDATKEEFFKLVHAPLAWLIVSIMIFAASRHLEIPPDWGLAPVSELGLQLVVARIYKLLLLIIFTWLILRVTDFLGLVLIRRAEKTSTKQDDQLIPFGIEAVKVILLIFSIFLALGSIFMINIGSLIAGLGIGGLALALAAKESLENLLGSFTIFFDKPFVVGDLVKVGDVLGVVEKVGFRSTRLRTMEKSYLTVPNKRMIDAELDNLSQRTFRRVSFTLGVTYDTTAEQIKAIVKDAQDLIDNHPNTNQDGKVRFMEFGASSLDIMILYFIDTMDWDVFLQVKEEINFSIMEIVQRHKSDFAFPSQTIYHQPNTP